MSSETLESVGDTFVGSKFGKGGCIQVIGWDGSIDKHKAKLYTVRCTECAKDKPLFKDGIFKIRKTSLVKGNIPCGCSPAPKWSTEQYKVLMSRLGETNGFKVLSYEGHPIQAKTLAKLSCNACNLEWSSYYNNLQGNKRCPACGILRAGIARLLPDVAAVKGFIASGSFVEGTTFNRLPRGATRKRAWQVCCPTCSNDEYSSAGLCNGLFTSLGANLQKGRIPCRCSSRFSFTKGQREYQIKKIIDTEKLGYTFVDWCGSGYAGAFSGFNVVCPHHGIWEASVDKFVNSGRRCPGCAKGGYSTQNVGYVYVLSISSPAGDFTGYGISNVPESRLKTHTRNLRESGFHIKNFYTVEVIGPKAPEIEALVKTAFPRHSQEIVGFKTEATYAYHYQDVINFVQQCLENDKQALTNENLQCTMAN